MEDKSKAYHFQARPVPKGILQGPVGVKPPKKIPVTVPETPDFALNNRLKSRRSFRSKLVQNNEENQTVVASKPAPHFGLPFQPRRDIKTTEPKPFSFEERDRKLKELKEVRMKKKQDEQKQNAEFQANPIPDLSCIVLPPKKTKPATKPVPFNLEVDVRGAEKAEALRRKIEEEIKQEREMAQFKARPTEAVAVESVAPVKSRKPLTDFQPVELNTDLRAEKRKEYKQWRLSKEQAEAEIRQDIEYNDLMEQRKTEERLRREAVHKAQGVGRYTGVTVKPSDKELTVPYTPQFSDRLKPHGGKP